MLGKISYLNNTVYAKIGKSDIHGVGVIAIRDIPEGTLITDYIGGGQKIFTATEEELNTLLPEIKALILDRIIYPKGTKEFKFMSPNHQCILRAFMNHSSNPNSDGTYALKDIKKGEEITEDYTTFGGGIHKLNLDNFNI